MTKLTLIKEALRSLAIELENEQNKNSSLKRALAKFFPLNLYIKLRPDVYQACNGDKEKIQDHYVSEGIKETDLISAREAKENFIMESLVKIIRDSKCTENLTEDKLKTSINQFSKTAGRGEAINSNDSHNFARNRTLHHYKSQTVCTWIPKNACSNLRYSIALANGVISNIEDIEWIHANNESFCASNQELLSASYTFVILRNPYLKILSFFLDKICHDNPRHSNDQSYQYAHDKLQTNRETTFEDFINYLWENPNTLKEDQHITPQCDFLIYKSYDDYFSIENMDNAIKTIYKKTGIKLVDVRDNNSIHTTKDKQLSHDFSHTTSAHNASQLLAQNKKPIPANMYTKDMIRKISSLYIADILLYSNVVTNGSAELAEWLKKAI